jgi:hypothetical protein
MHLYGGLSDADVTGNLFAEATARDLNHDLALPGAQGAKELLECRQGFLVLPPGTITSQADLYGIKEVLLAERLG